MWRWAMTSGPTALSFTQTARAAPAALLFSQMRTQPWALCVCPPFPLWPCFFSICLDCSCASLKFQLRGHLFSKALAVFFKTAKLLPLPTPTHLFPSSPYFPLSFFSLTPSGFLVYLLSSVFSYCSPHPHHENFMVKFMWTLCRSILFMSVCRKTCLSVFFSLFGCLLEYRGLPSSPYKGSLVSSGDGHLS